MFSGGEVQKIERSGDLLKNFYFRAQDESALWDPSVFFRRQAYQGHHEQLQTEVWVPEAPPPMIITS